MSARQYQLVYVVLIMAILLLVGWWISGFFRDDDHAERNSATTAPSTVVATTTSSVGDEVTLEKLKSELIERADRFLRAYFSRLPDDTAAKFVERLEPVASEEFLRTLDQHTFNREPFISLKASGSAVRPRFDIHGAVVSFNDRMPDAALVEIKLDLVQTESDGSSQVIRGGMVYAAEWKLVEGKWYVYPSLPR